MRVEPHEVLESSKRKDFLMASESTPVRAIVDIKTGKVTGEIYEGDRIVRKESLEYYNKTINISENHQYIKWFRSTMSGLRGEKLSSNQWRILITVVEYFQYDTGLIAYANGLSLKVDAISMLSGVPLRSCFRDIEILISKEIIAKSKIGHDIKFYINPFLFSIGKRVSKALYDMFENSKWRGIYYDITNPSN